MNSCFNESRGKYIVAYLLAVATAVFTPLAVMGELLSVRTVWMLPSIGYVFLRNYADNGAANFSALFTLIASARLLDVRFMLVIFVMCILPILVLRIFEKRSRSFGERMQAAVIAFLVCAVLSVVLMYVFFGGNMIENYLGKLSELLRSISEEELSGGLNMISGFLNEEITVEQFYLLFDESIQNLISLYKLNMTGLLLSGAMLSAVVTTWLDGMLRHRNNPEDENACLPIDKWYLPASTTGGLLLIFGISLILYFANESYGMTVFASVYRIVVAAFCVQGFASVRRRALAFKKKALGVILTLGYLLLWLFGASTYFALYGVCSAVFGSGGVFKQHMDAKMHHEDKDD